ncbi:MAG: hypothetical protein J1E43_08770 [Christensenellaceae bacterium]|nr:hypothetical protein [Christensenellaceae bacterium]
MELTIRRLTPELLDDFQQFFDGDAFSGHEEWAGCYCLESHLDPKKNERLMPFAGVLETRRWMAMAMVEQGVTNGYPVYDGSCVIGWCNAGDKRDYLPVCREEQLITEPHERGKTKLLYCFDIAPPCWSSVFWPTRSRRVISTPKRIRAGTRTSPASAAAPSDCTGNTSSRLTAKPAGAL